MLILINNGHVLLVSFVKYESFNNFLVGAQLRAEVAYSGGAPELVTAG